jgi:hypothetical protein
MNLTLRERVALALINGRDAGAAPVAENEMAGEVAAIDEWCREWLEVGDDE